MARKTIGSAALAASCGAASLCGLVLLLDPAPSLRSEAVALVVCLLVPWTCLGTVALSLLAAASLVLRWSTRPRPIVTGRPFFAALAFVVLAYVGAVYWHNLLAYRHALPLESVRALLASAVVITAAAAALVAVGLDLVLFPRRERWLSAIVAVLAPGAAVAVPLVLRPVLPAPHRPAAIRLAAEPSPRRVYVVGIDGLSYSDLARDPAEARVPWLARLARRGAAAPLATVRPAEAPPVWASLMTGELPRDHGVRSASSYRLLASQSDWPLLPKGTLVGLLERVGLVSHRPVPSTVRVRRAVWNVLDALGVPCGLVAVAGTHPPEPIRGFVVSPYFHALRGDPSRAAAALHPRELLPEAEARTLAPADVDPAVLRELADPVEPGAPPLDDAVLRRLAEHAVAPDLSHERIGDVLREAYRPSLFVIAFRGYAEVARRFYRYAHPEAFGNVRPDEARRYGRVLSAYAAFIGRWVAQLERELRPEDVLIVVSGRGLAPTPLWQRLLGGLAGAEVGDASPAGASSGVLVVTGGVIRSDVIVEQASVLDVTPTILYLMGLPVARDMEGRVLSEIVRAEFAIENPVTFIQSYESLAVARAATGSPEVEDLPPLPEELP